ncbi:hypothetical protein BDR22DRAFT_179235 [Usnea florida]
MAAYTAIEECERSFASPCEQVGCLHASSPSCLRAECDMLNPANLFQTTSLSIKLGSPTASPSETALDFKTYSIPDPLSRCPILAASVEPGKKTGRTNFRGERERESDRYVMKKCYRPCYDEGCTFKIKITQTPILITQLRPSEQNAAYEAILSRAPIHKVPEYYMLHLSRLDNIHGDIAKVQVDYNMFVRESDDERRPMVAGWESDEIKHVEETLRAYQRAIKHRKNLEACERGIRRLSERCVEILEREELKYTCS